MQTLGATQLGGPHSIIPDVAIAFTNYNSRY